MIRTKSLIIISSKIKSLTRVTQKETLWAQKLPDIRLAKGAHGNKSTRRKATDRKSIS